MTAADPSLPSAPRSYAQLGVQVPTVLLPAPGVDPSRWAVVAVDQYTSQPDYWQAVEGLVGAAPSTLRLILPEIYLGKPDEAERVGRARQMMQTYLHDGTLVPHEGLIYVERKLKDKTRRGLMLCLDLERYDYNQGSQSLIRATEGTILERLPPRMKIRRGAALELPHILVLIDDPEASVIEPLTALKDQPGRMGRMEPLYDFELMQDGGHLSGYRLSDPALEAQVMAALEKLADPAAFRAKYGLPQDQQVLLFAMGDGNHSLATAKAVWEELKPTLEQDGSAPPDHPARYALVEIENVHDAGLEFEPIHRVIFGLNGDPLAALAEFFGDTIRIGESKDCDEMFARIEQAGAVQAAGMSSGRRFWTLEFLRPSSNLAVGTLQPFIEMAMVSGLGASVDYVHGNCVACKLASETGNLAFYLPGMQKSELFQTVLLDGALPKKTFSMGEAHEKRYYMECRQIGL